MKFTAIRKMSRAKKYTLLGCLVAIELILYIFLLFLGDVFSAKISSYSSILVCVVFAMTIFLFLQSKQSLIIFLALIFTALSDLFLVVFTETDKSLPMCFFCVAQLLYMTFLLLIAKDKSERLASIFTRFAIFIVLEICGAIVMSGASFLVFITLFYFANLLSNVIFAFLHIKKLALLAVGLLLFMLCDIFVGFEFLSIVLPLSSTHIIYRLSHSGLNIAWLFYLPSQVLIVLSSLFSHPTSHHNKPEPENLIKSEAETIANNKFENSDDAKNSSKQSTKTGP